MSWLQTNRWLGRFLIALGAGTLLTLVFLFYARSNFGEAKTQFDQAAAERSRLEHRDPFPSDANYLKLKTHIDNYGAAFDKFKEELKGHTLPAVPLAPNEFQSRLRQAMVASAEKARGNKVKMPDNFALGFNEFTAALPTNELAPLLGQELAQVEVLMNLLIEARVDGVMALARRPFAPTGAGAATTPAPGGKAAATAASSGPKTIERNIVDLTFVAAPSAARKVLNQIASSNQQLYIVRTLHVRNEKEKGPARDQTTTSGTAADQPSPSSGLAGTAASTGQKAASNAALNFIVGNEHIEVSARIEMLRLTF